MGYETAWMLERVTQGVRSLARTWKALDRETGQRLDWEYGRRDKPTVCLDVISLMASSCGYDSGQIEQLVAHEMERLRNGQNTALNSTRSPSRMCGSVTTGVYG